MPPADMKGATAALRIRGVALVGIPTPNSEIDGQAAERPQSFLQTPQIEDLPPEQMNANSHGSPTNPGGADRLEGKCRGQRRASAI